MDNLLYLLLHHKKRYEERVKKYVKLYANDNNKKNNEINKDLNVKKAKSEEYTLRHSFKSHSISIDINYNFYEDDDNSPVYENEDDKSCISSNSSLNEELDFGKFLRICLTVFNDLLSLVLVTVHVFTIKISASSFDPNLNPAFINLSVITCDSYALTLHPNVYI